MKRKNVKVEKSSKQSLPNVLRALANTGTKCDCNLHYTPIWSARSPAVVRMANDTASQYVRHRTTTDWSESRGWQCRHL